MKKFSEQLHKKSQTVKLRAAEKRELHERVVSYMEYHPLPTELKSTKKVDKLNASPILAEPFTTFAVPFRALFKYSAVMAVMILVIVPFVAERAVPGDVLYAVKVQFNEELRGTLTFDSFEKVEWETERLNRRIAEARLLASEGRLTPEAEADVAEAVRTHSANAQREIDELRTEDADAATIASITLDTTLEVQSSSFKTEDEADVDSDSELVTKPASLIASAIDESRSKTDDVTSSSTLPSYAKLMSRVEQNTTRIFELIQPLEEVAPVDDITSVKRRNEDINRSLAEAIESFTEDELKAREQLLEILQRTERLIIFINEIEITNTIDIETLIPVQLTEEEREVEKSSSIASLTQKEQLIEVELESFAGEVAVIDKVAAGQADINELLSKMSSSSVSFVSFRIYAEQGHAIADDIILILEPDVTSEELVVEEEIATTTEDVIVEEEEVVEATATSTEVTTATTSVSIEESVTPPAEPIEIPNPTPIEEVE